MEHRNNKNLTTGSGFCINSITGNVIPSIWYQIFLTKSGRLDKVAIDLLAEIVYWYKESKFGSKKKFAGDFLNLRYSTLISKFNISRDTIRRAFVRLEEKGVIKRILKDIDNRNTFCANALFIDLDVNKLQSLCNEFESKNDISTPLKKGNLSSSNTEILVSGRTNPIDKKNSLSKQIKVMSTLFCLDVYGEKKERIKAKSLGLSFINFEGSEKKQGIEIDEEFTKSSSNDLNKNSREIISSLKSTTHNRFVRSSTKFSDFNSYKKLSCYNFLPIPEDLCDDLRSELGIDYPDSYFEATLIKMIEMDKASLATRNDELNSEQTSELVPIWSIRQLKSRLLAWSRREFKSLDEIRERLGLLSGNEIIEARGVKESEKKIKNYDNALLARYEDSKDTSPLGVIKRKIAGSLPREIALTLLKSSNIEIKSHDFDISTTTIPRQVLSVRVRDNFYDTAKLNSTCYDVLDLKRIKDLLEPLTKSVIGEGARVSLETTSNLVSNPSTNSNIYSNSNNSNILTQGKKLLLVQESFSKNHETKEIQKSLLDDLGVDIYYSWFRETKFEFLDRDLDKSRASDNLSLEEKSSLKLRITTDSKFRRDYLRANYKLSIQKILELKNKMCCNVEVAVLGEGFFGGLQPSCAVEIVTEAECESRNQYIEESLDLRL